MKTNIEYRPYFGWIISEMHGKNMHKVILRNTNPVINPYPYYGGRTQGGLYGPYIPSLYEETFYALEDIKIKYTQMKHDFTRGTRKQPNEGGNA